MSRWCSTEIRGTGAGAGLRPIVIQNITEAASQKLQLEKGDIQIATGISQDQVPSLEQNPNVGVQFSASTTTYYLFMNNDPDVGGPFSDPKVQEAVRYALDYDGILRPLGPARRVWLASSRRTSPGPCLTPRR